MALVFGGGDTAMDATRVARRLTGNPATIVYRRTRSEMPASAEELEGALEEGNILEELAAPTRVILKDGRVVALECIRNTLGDPGPDGRRRPVPIKGSEFQIEADSVIVAIGQLPDLYFLRGSDVSMHKNGSIAVNPRNGLAGVSHIYAGGDVVEGPKSIIAACADGRRAAEAICKEFGISFEQSPSHPAALSEDDIAQVKRVRARKEAQHKAAMRPPAQRTGFDLIEATLTEEAARAEALRCVQCAAFCDKCVEVCPNRANLTYFISPVTWRVPRLVCRGNELVEVGAEAFAVTQVRQIIHIDDLCNECGNCDTFCAHHGKPYRDKPRLFFKPGDFAQEQDNAFLIEKTGSGLTMRRRAGGQEWRLTVAGDGEMLFDNGSLRVTLAPDFQIKRKELARPFAGEVSLASAAEMLVILQGLTDSMPFLPVG
jgi:putative selenate reductase